MRATLESDGTLRITPDTTTEAYALACWSEKRRGRNKPAPALAVETEVAPLTARYDGMSLVYTSPTTVGTVGNPNTNGTLP